MLGFLVILATVVVAASFAYAVVSMAAVLRFRIRLRRARPAATWRPATLLKPLCGREFELEENLASFCRQEGGDYQVVFGVHDAADPAVAVVERLRARFPERDIALIVDPTIVGSNQKVGNLANMMPAARYDLIVVSDSDMRVGPDCLARVIAPFADPAVGAATCVYCGRPGPGWVSRVGAMFINEWFLASALIPAVFGKLSFCFGATMAVRRDALEAIGSFEALADLLADDYMLGNRVAALGMKVALAPYLVENVVDEPTLKGLFLHELRWARTIRSVRPIGYALMSITEVLPLTFLAAGLLVAVSASAMPAIGLAAGGVAVRLAQHAAVHSILPAASRGRFWLIPLRDLLSLAVRVASFFGSKVLWREQAFVIHDGNRLTAAK
ncbi:MAG: bacteriohopanetetrol glucosamine biosynthesis glycosyltransferase HpnI [Rhodospirillales bacterium]|jgi:ceramide glucosyltransferase|nr:bacteriohopanetetrol glucosamine biosynthesis glycosyltransferase HpnI [Rhodospirillales bacterium]